MTARQRVPRGPVRVQYDSPQDYDGKVRPFGSGSEYAGWEDRNCARCRRSGQQPDGDYVWGSCALEDALTEACIGDGRIPQALARAYGATVRFELHWADGALSHRLMAVPTEDGRVGELRAVPQLPEDEAAMVLKGFCELPMDCELRRA